MLRLEIPPGEVYDEKSNTFTSTNKSTVLTLEHSLVSVSKWESTWCVPFLSKREKSSLETLDYIRHMTLTQNVDDVVYGTLTGSNFQAIKNYIEAPMTATKITDRSHKPNREIVTAELIYYWMIALNIPFECQKWHLNRLLMLINVCSIKQDSNPKKLRGKALLKSNAALNEARRAQLGSKG